jgi:diacylglycerol O-acyltransferase
VPWQPRPIPDPLTLLQDAVRDQLTETAHRWADESFRLLQPAEVGERVRQLTNALISALPAFLRPAPRTSFNRPLSGERQFAWAELPVAEIRSIRSVLGGTINDVVLAVIAGALGRYLRKHGSPTEGVELHAMCPVSMRRPDERGALGNLVSWMLAPLYVGITNPVQRLAAERAAMERLKQQDQAGGLYTLTALANCIPPAWQAVAGRATVPNMLLNTVSTNVPGPQTPLYLGRHKLVAWCPLGITAANIGLFNAILSYNQKLTIGVMVDPQQVPDVWFYVDCLKESFAELLAAAECRAATGPPPDPVQEQEAA